MIRLEWLLFMQIGMGILMIILLQKLIQMKKQVDEIMQEVTNYITFITENEEKSASEDVFFEEQKSNIKQNSMKSRSVKELESVQNQLIQAVLGDFFP